MSRKVPLPTAATLADLDAAAKWHQAKADQLQREAASAQSIANGYRKAAQRIRRAAKAAP